MNEFSRKLNLQTSPRLKYIPLSKIKYDKKEENTNIKYNLKLKNYHLGQVKLFYSELEFLTLVSKYVNLSECLIVYIGSSDGKRLGEIFLQYFPNTKYLLYDPGFTEEQFKVKDRKTFIVKGDVNGFFTDESVEEVLEIAQGRKIIYISDIRRVDENDKYNNEKMIYEQMLDQQRWGIMMNADFMLLKFRMFFYQYSIDEIDFIDNTYMNDNLYKKIKIVGEDRSDDKFSLCYLNGDIYTQIHPPVKSPETRLFVKKNKYYTNNTSDPDSYNFTYYSSVAYEEVLYYYNNIIRNNEIVYKNSYKITNIIPGAFNTYNTAAEYYIIEKYCKIFLKLEPTFDLILSHLIKIYTYFNTEWNNNQIISVIKNFKIDKDDIKIITNTLKINGYTDKEVRDIINQRYVCYKDFKSYYIQHNLNKFLFQFKNLKKLNTEDSELLINSYNNENKHGNNIFIIKDGEIKILYKYIGDFNSIINKYRHLLIDVLFDDSIIE